MESAVTPPESPRQRARRRASTQRGRFLDSSGVGAVWSTRRSLINTARLTHASHRYVAFNEAATSVCDEGACDALARTGCGHALRHALVAQK